MNRAAKKYLRQVRRHLCCPGSLRKEFLRQLEDDVLLFCDEQEKISDEQMVEHFGQPADVAADFFTDADPKAVSRFAYSRLRAAYLTLAAVAVMALAAVSVSAVHYVETQHMASGARVAGTYDHRNGTECVCFTVRTNHRGEDVYWEYHSCLNRMTLSIPPEDFDGTEPYAVDIYLNNNGNIEHWTFGDEHRDWIRVYDEEKG